MPRHPLAARLYLVRGRVQGVGYRDYAQRAASALGLTGYVRNLDDGRVEVYAAGPPDKLSDLAAALRKGPRFLRCARRGRAGSRAAALFRFSN